MADRAAPITITRRDLLKLGGAAVAAEAVLPHLDGGAAEAQTPKRTTLSTGIPPSSASSRRRSSSPSAVRRAIS